MEISVPPPIFEKPPGSLVVSQTGDRLTLFLREDEWGLGKYPHRCPAELRIAAWDRDPVLLVALLLRLADRNLTTFEHWIDAGQPLGVRELKLISRQQSFDIYLVTTRPVRRFGCPNRLMTVASGLVMRLRERPAWGAEAFAKTRAQSITLYPTAAALWRGYGGTGGVRQGAPAHADGH